MPESDTIPRLIRGRSSLSLLYPYSTTSLLSEYEEIDVMSWKHAPPVEALFLQLCRKSNLLALSIPLYSSDIIRDVRTDFPIGVSVSSAHSSNR